MKKLVLALFLASCSSGIATPQQEVAQVAKELASTVKIHEEVTMVLKLPDMPERNSDTSIMSGSGVILAHRKHGHETHALIATAKHVCTAAPVPIPPGLESVVHYRRDITVETIDGFEVTGAVQYLAKDDDLCFIDVPTYLGPEADLARYAPNIGTRVNWTGAPKGLWSDSQNKLAVVSEGVYSGIAPGQFGRPLMVFSGNAVPGNSGGPIFDRASGHVVSILIASVTKEGLLCLGVPLTIIQEEFVAAVDLWQAF